MLKAPGLLIFIIIFVAFTGYGQVNFKKVWLLDDPVKSGATVPISEKIKIHETFLAKAIEAADTIRQFYGLLYLQADHYDDINYEESTRYLMQAENLAKASGYKNWQGVVKRKSGWLTYLVHQDLQGAIKEYEAGARLCLEAKDSFCYSECMEHIAAMYSRLREFEKSRKYFDIAIPILENYDKGSLASAYNNLSTLYGFQNLQVEAIQFLDSAIKYNREKNNPRQELAFRFNRGLALIELNQPDSAIKGYLKSMTINKENNWLENLANDYDGMAHAYEKKGDFRTAFGYLVKHHNLKDSLFNEDMKTKVARLMAKNKLQQQEIALKKSQVELAVERRRSETRAWIILLGLAILTFILWIRWSEKKKEKRQRLQSRENLSELTRILLDKNSMLLEMEKKVAMLEAGFQTEPPIYKAGDDARLLKDIPGTKFQPIEDHSPETNGVEMNLYNQKILTGDDWTAFKVYFEKVYPGFLRRVRDTYPSITEAEERLFLFIKLNLTNKEAASILGISADSVKKTRTRLRKRLALDEKMDMDDFVRLF